MKFISSPHNPFYRRLKTLGTNKGIREEKLILLSGEKLVHEFLKSPNLEILGEIFPPDLKPLSGIENALELSNSLFDAVDELGTGFNILILKKPNQIKWDPLSEPHGLEVICPLGDPQNVGALLRTCEGFGVRKIILTSESASPFLPKAIKASAGSALRVLTERADSLRKTIETLETSPFAESTFILAQNGKNIQNVRWPKNLRLVIGEEGPGFSQQELFQSVSIPTEKIESLNATVAASLAIYSCQTARSAHSK